MEIVTKQLQERPKIGDVISLPNGEEVRVRSVGLPWLLPPRVVCNDPKCPWHGHTSIRGEVLRGVVDSVYGNHAVVVHEWLHYVPKYKRYERRRKKIHAYLPRCVSVKVGEEVTIGETRPLSKATAFVVLGTSKDTTSIKPKMESI
ncbi:30S ribosomal protein S17 [Thermocladium modestius]|uniref:30S ribosomal protein S17 n=1 Tax=Thermocladium modestius TaxID=62609 RepID=A0A830GXV5_9CREN|nr:30S ribosomal protein S17 [Thermocladium modestius]GGP22015.1 30S ribosomal protein S17 [Thermocladium modestius]